MLFYFPAQYAPAGTTSGDTSGICVFDEDCLYIIMYSNSRKIEGRGTIKRPDNIQYINTSYLPPQRTIQAVNYYTRRKQQLKLGPQNNPTSPDFPKKPEKTQVKQQINSMMSKGHNPNISNHIKEVHVEPIINQDRNAEINEESYHLDDDEKVKVVEERYFPMQNYYHFVYQSELKKEIYKFANQTEAKVMEVVKDRNGDESFQGESVKHDLSRYENQKGMNASKYQSKVKQNVPIKELVPKHIDYAGSNYRQNGLFTVNQNQRMEMSRRR